MILPVTLVIAAACGLLNLWLALRVSQRRIAKQVMLGDGGDSLMVSRGRAHANYTEYAPFVLVLIAAIELARGDSPWLWGLGAVFVLARLAHPIGMDRPAPNPFRLGGIALTWTVIALLAGWALVIAYQASRNPGPTDAIEVAPASA